MAFGRNKFKLCLVNDTTYNVVYECVLKLTHQVKHKKDGKIDSGTTEFIYKFLYDDLNNAPSIELELWQLTTAGIGDKKRKTLKIKAKQFFKKVKNIPLVGEQGHVYTVLNKYYS